MSPAGRPRGVPNRRRTRALPAAARARDEWLRAGLAAAGLTQDALAERMGVSSRALRRWVRRGDPGPARGAVIPGPTSTTTIAAALGVPPLE